MATTKQYSEADLQEIINTRYNQEAGAPDDDEDSSLRRSLLNQFIQDWSRETGVIWEALRTNTGALNTGATLVLSTGVTAYDAPDEFEKLAGKVYLYDASGNLKYRVPVVKASESGDYRGRQQLRAFVTGNPKDGYQINFTKVTSEMNGWTMVYDFQRTATLFTDADQYTEVPDPFFLAFMTLAELHRPSRVALATQYENDARRRMESMILDNLMPTPGEAFELNQGWSYLDTTQSRSFFDA